MITVLALEICVSAQASKTPEGRKIYDQQCAKCHGPDGAGNTTVGKAVGAKDLRSPETQKLTDEEIYAQIENGKGNMPPFRGTLNKDQINSLIPVIRELGKQDKPPN